MNNIIECTHLADRRYGKDQESIDSGYGGNQQNRITKYEGSFEIYFQTLFCDKYLL